jgi:hypothetical protein
MEALYTSLRILLEDMEEVVEEREVEVLVGVEVEVVGVEVVIIVVHVLLHVGREEVDLNPETDLVLFLQKEDLLLDRNHLDHLNVVLLVPYLPKNILNHLLNLLNVLVLDPKDQDLLHLNPHPDLPILQKEENLNLNLFLLVDLEVIDLQRGKAHLKT